MRNDKHCHIITGCEDKELIYTNIIYTNIL